MIFGNVYQSAAVEDLESESGMLCDKLDPTEPLATLILVLVEVERPSLFLLVAETMSDEEDEGAKVPIEVPTGYGATDMSASDDADEL